MSGWQHRVQFATGQHHVIAGRPVVRPADQRLRGVTVAQLCCGDRRSSRNEWGRFDAANANVRRSRRRNAKIKDVSEGAAVF